MTVDRLFPSAALALLALAACSRSATQTAATQPAPAAVVTPGAAAPVTTAPAATAAALPPPATTGGYSCTFPGPDGRPILARFTLDGAAAHDDQGLTFNVLANSPTALVLAHPRDDLAATPGGDIGAYVVAIDRRTLGMVQSTVGLSGPGATRRGRCIAG